MILPSKLFSYKDSILSKFPFVLNTLKEKSWGVKDFYWYCKNQKIVNNSIEFLEIMDCLYILGKADYDDKLKVVCYVETNRM